MGPFLLACATVRFPAGYSTTYARTRRSTRVRVRGMITLAPATIAAAVAALSLGGSAGALTRVQGGLHTNIYVPRSGWSSNTADEEPRDRGRPAPLRPLLVTEREADGFHGGLCHFCSGE